MVFLQANPLDPLLVEAEEAPRPCAPPCHVRRQTEAGLLQDPKYVGTNQAILTERVDRSDVGLVADVPLTVFVRPQTNVVHDLVVSYVSLERLQLEHLRAPSTVVRRQQAAIYREPVVESVPRGGLRDPLSEERLQPREIRVGFRQLLIRIVKDVLHLRNAVPHVDRQSRAVFAT